MEHGGGLYLAEQFTGSVVSQRLRAPRKNLHQLPLRSRNVLVALYSLKPGFNPRAGSGSWERWDW